MKTLSPAHVDIKIKTGSLLWWRDPGVVNSDETVFVFFSRAVISE